ncbi:MAG: hypothetical protein QNK37_01250 [Acidobacteriota bacterium]|nr:hypothetical protein [Acidobacteriota bacterium]
MLSLVILLTAVLGMAAAYQHRIFQSTAAKNQAIAAMIAQSIANEMMSTDPETWSKDALTKNFEYTYEGKRNDGSGVTYYTAEVEFSPNANWYEVQIGISWSGWKAERGKVGDSDSLDFAYTLDMAIAPNYGDEENP